MNPILHAADAFIVSAREMSRNPDKQATPKDNCEVTRSLLMDAAPYALWGQVALGGWLSGDAGLVVHSRFEGKKIDETFSFSRMCRIVNEFYKTRFDEEWGKFYKKSHFSEAEARSRLLVKASETGGDAAMLLRVGHYSHIECVTIRNNKPRTRKKKNASFGIFASFCCE